MRRSGGRVRAAALAFVLALPAAHAGRAEEPAPDLAGAPAAPQPEPRAWPPAPWTLLRGDLLRTPMLDATPPCVPSSVPQSDRDRVRAALADPEQAAARLEPGDEPALAGLAADLLRARLAAERADRRSARNALLARLAADGDPGVEACVRLETARLELALGRLPEAAAQAFSADRLRARADASLRVGASADFLRAEALQRAGRADEAAVLQRLLQRSPDEALAAAARLRLADALFDAGDETRAREDYEALLPHAEQFGASLSGWGLRAAEAALLDGDVDAARGWLEAVEREADSERADAARIRLADLHVVRGEPDRARELLVTVAATPRETPLARLAALRLLAHRLDRDEPAQRLEQLAEAARDAELGLAQYARGLLGAALLEANEPARALDVLARLAFDAPPPERAPALTAHLDAALHQLAAGTRGEAECAALVEVLGFRRRFLARIATDFEPFLALGRCYATLGLPTSAIEVYRTVAGQFGSLGAERVALPLARAAFAAGDSAATRTAALARAERDGPERAAWRLLLARTELVRGRPAAAAALLRDVVAAGEPRHEHVTALVTLARAVAALPEARPDRELLRSAVEALSEAQRETAEAGEAALVAAEAHRRAGALGSARALYGLALRGLPPGARRSEAAYWIGALAPDASTARASLQVAAEAPASGPWPRLSAGRLGLIELRGSLGDPAWSPDAGTRR